MWINYIYIAKIGENAAHFWKKFWVHHIELHLWFAQRTSPGLSSLRKWKKKILLVSRNSQLMFISKSHDVFYRRIFLLEIFIIRARTNLQQFRRDAAPIKQILKLLDGHISNADVHDFSSWFEIFRFCPDSLDFARADFLFESENQRIGVFEVNFGEDRVDARLKIFN